MRALCWGLEGGKSETEGSRAMLALRGTCSVRRKEAGVVGRGVGGRQATGNRQAGKHTGEVLPYETTESALRGERLFLLGTGRVLGAGASHLHGYLSGHGI